MNLPHHLVMDALDVSMQIRPTKTSDIAARIGAVVAEQEYGILKDILRLVLDAQV